MGCCKCEVYGWADPQKAVWTDPADGEEYCVFHAPKEHKLDSEGRPLSVVDFNALISERIQATVDLEDKNAECNLRGVVFPGDICFCSGYLLPAISFQEARFEGAANFSYATFGGEANFWNVSFGGEADFSEASFGREAYFWNASFVGDADFRNASFGGDADFRNASFGGDADFWNANFGGDAYFRSASFGREAYFWSARFGGDADFWNASFGGSAHFLSASFVGAADFLSASFGREADFRSASFVGAADFMSASFGGDADFNSASFLKRSVFADLTIKPGIQFNFSSAIIGSEPIYFQNCPGLRDAKLNFNGVLNVANLHFENCEWPEEHGRIKVAVEDEPEQLQATRDFYQRMKRKYKDEHNEYEASRWHIAEKEAQLRLLKDKAQLNLFWKQPGRVWKNRESVYLLWMLWIYKQISGFGENPLRGFGVLLSLVFLPFFILISADVSRHFSWWSIDGARANELAKEWLRYLPLTKAEALTQTPGLLHAGMMFWQLFVTIQAALFAFALRNRFRR